MRKIKYCGHKYKTTKAGWIVIDWNDENTLPPCDTNMYGLYVAFRPEFDNEAILIGEATFGNEPYIVDPDDYISEEDKQTDRQSFWGYDVKNNAYYRYKNTSVLAWMPEPKIDFM